MSGLYQAARASFLTAGIDWNTHTIKAALLSATYTVNLATHDFYNDLSGVVSTSAALSGKTYSNGVADCSDITFTAVTGDPCTQMVVFRDTGNVATSPLIAHVNTGSGLPVTPNGGDIVVVIDSNGLFTL